MPTTDSRLWPLPPQDSSGHSPHPSPPALGGPAPSPGKADFYAVTTANADRRVERIHCEEESVSGARDSLPEHFVAALPQTLGFRGTEARRGRKERRDKGNAKGTSGLLKTQRLAASDAVLKGRLRARTAVPAWKAFSCRERRRRSCPSQAAKKARTKGEAS